MPTIADLERRAAGLRKHVTRTIELPNPGFLLDVISRRGNEMRLFKHLLQNGNLHAEHFALTHQIKVSILADGYLQSYKDRNALGPYLYARSMLELLAFVHEITRRALEISNKPDAQWRVSGEEFFSLMVRARFASSDPAKVKALVGLPKSLSKPINISSCFQQLAKWSLAADLASKYDFLCDYVHHNFSSQMATIAGIKQGTSAKSSGGGTMIVGDGQPFEIIRYEYPMPTASDSAVAETLSIMLESIELSVRCLNAMPRRPFSDEQVQMRTGSILGMTNISLVVND